MIYIDHMKSLHSTPSCASRSSRIFVDTYLPYDTGGPEALVQLAVAAYTALPGRVFIWRRMVHKRMLSEYGSLGLDDAPVAHGLLETITCPGDVLIAGDVRTEFCAFPWLAARNVTLFTYVLSINFLGTLLRSAAKRPAHCRFLSHSHKLAEPSTVHLPDSPGQLVSPRPASRNRS